MAFTGEGSLKVASAMLVVAIVVALVGYAYADNRRLGWGALALIAATLPLFGVLYAIGAAIMGHLGVAVAGGVLIGLSVAVAASAVVMLTHAARDKDSVRLGGPVRRGAPIAPSER